MYWKIIRREKKILTTKIILEKIVYLRQIYYYELNSLFFINFNKLSLLYIEMMEYQFKIKWDDNPLQIEVDY